MAGSSRRVSPVRFHALIALAATTAGAGAGWWLTGRTSSWPILLTCWLGAVNVVTFLYYGYDKARARQGASRVPELVLHGLAAAGGSPAALAAMQVFRHKTVKGPFRLVFWLIVVVQVLLVVWLVKRLVWPPTE